MTKKGIELNGVNAAKMKYLHYTTHFFLQKQKNIKTQFLIIKIEKKQQRKKRINTKENPK
jgi:hypothetical protein